MVPWPTRFEERAVPSTSTEPLADDSVRITIHDNHRARELIGEDRSNLRSVERALGVRIAVRGNVLTVTGTPAALALADRLIAQIVEVMDTGYPLSRAEISHSAGLLALHPDADLRTWYGDTILMSSRQQPVTPRSPTQKRYVEAIRAHDIVFGLGPAGTGKTYLAVAMAVATYQRGDVRRIVLTRPAVEAGEKLGFLPGDLADKVDPYLRPLYDALHDMLEGARSTRLLEQGAIEIAPLAFMRGRTLGKSFVILDEAQNTTPEQMKMFLTRLGLESKAVITGDLTQVDLPDGRPSGLWEARRILRAVEEIPFVEFGKEDVVRHPLVQRIVEAYEADTIAREGRRNQERPVGRQP